MVKPAIRIDRAPPIVTITIDRPEVRNALDRAASAELARAFRAFEADAESLVAILTGSGGAFCSGADLKELATGALYEPWAASADGPTAQTLSKPVIAAIEGTACAGGLGLALWCDLRVIDETAVFGVFSRRVGVPDSSGTTVRLPRLIGLSRALDLLLTGRPVNAEEALAIGLANRMAPRGETRAHAEVLAREIASYPQGALLCDRRSAHQESDRTLHEALRLEAEGSRVARERDAALGAARYVVDRSERDR